MTPAPPLLLLFVKDPVPGKVKTRLGASIGHDQAVRVYQELLQYTREQAEQLAVDKIVWYGNDFPEEDLWSEVGYPRYEQVGANLGLRMLHAFELGFAQGYQRVVIIGSDCAMLTAEIIAEAFDQLETFDAVLGPATDGGYYLLGMKEPLPTVFQNKQWSTETVGTDTLRDFAEAGKSVFLLPLLSDIDTEADLAGTFLEKYQVNYNQ